jgi:predicted transcriptional regulator
MQEHRTRDITQQMIIEALQKSPKPLTRTQIARALNRKKAPHIIELIEEMVNANILRQEVKTFHNGVKGYIYSLVSDEQ